MELSRYIQQREIEDKKRNLRDKRFAKIGGLVSIISALAGSFGVHTYQQVAQQLSPYAPIPDVLTLEDQTQKELVRLQDPEYRHSRDAGDTAQKDLQSLAPLAEKLSGSGAIRFNHLLNDSIAASAQDNLGIATDDLDRAQSVLKEIESSFPPRDVEKVNELRKNQADVAGIILFTGVSALAIGFTSTIFGTNATTDEDINQAKHTAKRLITRLKSQRRTK